MSHSDSPNLKNTLRVALRERRVTHAGNPKTREQLTSRLSNLSQSLGAKVVAAYLPFSTEPDIGGFLDWAKTNGVRLIMPVSNADGTLGWVSYDDETRIGIFGFAEPSGPAAKLSDAQLIVIPASAADRNGNRLGKGKGYYDKALAEPDVHGIPVAAVIYTDELLDEIPTEAHDHPVDFVVTPESCVAIPKS
jgi:5-formyltetrahydrofolate cyclo-ligase